MRLFDTTCERDAERLGDEYDYDQLFTRDAKGRPVRRLKVVETGAPTPRERDVF